MVSNNNGSSSIASLNNSDVYHIDICKHYLSLYICILADSRTNIFEAIMQGHKIASSAFSVAQHLPISFTNTHIHVCT